MGYRPGVVHKHMLRIKIHSYDLNATVIIIKIIEAEENPSI